MGACAPLAHANSYGPRISKRTKKIERRVKERHQISELVNVERSKDGTNKMRDISKKHKW